NRSASIAWSPPVTGDAPSGYELRRKGADAIVTVPATSLSAVVDGLRNGEEYQIYVRALNRAGRGPEVPAPPVTPTSAVPAAVEGITAVGGNQQATVSWEQLPDRDIDGYIVTGIASGSGDGAAPTMTPVEVSGEESEVTID